MTPYQDWIKHLDSNIVLQVYEVNENSFKARFADLLLEFKLQDEGSVWKFEERVTTRPLTISKRQKTRHLSHRITCRGSYLNTDEEGPKIIRQISQITAQNEAI